MPGEFPHMCSLYRLHNGFNVFLGGASLVSPNKVVTLASAVKDYKDSEGTCQEDIRPIHELYVVCGSVNLQIPDEAGEQSRKVSGVLLHPDFNQKSLINDVAVLIVEEKFEYTESVGPVCLPEPGQFVGVNTTCVATGHGKDSEGQFGYFTNKLRKVNLPIWSDEQCEKILNEKYFKQNHSIIWQSHPSFLCAGGNESEDTCEGDGGGPLVCFSSASLASLPPSAGAPSQFDGADQDDFDANVFGDELDVFADEADVDQRGSSFDLRTSDAEDYLIQYGVTAWGVGCALTGIPSVYSSLASPPIRCWLDQILSCYDGDDEDAYAYSESYSEADYSFDLRSENAKSTAGLTEAQCGLWFNSDISKSAACDCEWKLESVTNNIDDSQNEADFDLRETGFDLRTVD